MPGSFAPWPEEHCSGGMRAPLQYWPMTGVLLGVTLPTEPTVFTFAALSESLKMEYEAGRPIGPASLRLAVTPLPPLPMVYEPAPTVAVLNTNVWPFWLGSKSMRTPRSQYSSWPAGGVMH